MKIYALFSGAYSDTIFWGVFTTREAAQRVIDRARADAGAKWTSLASEDTGYDAPRIEERETDLSWDDVKELRWMGLP